MNLAYPLAAAVAALLVSAAGAMAQDPPPADQRPQPPATVVNQPGTVHRVPVETRPSDTTPGATVNVTLVTNGPVPDTAENRAKFGKPLSHAGRNTKPTGN